MHADVGRTAHDRLTFLRDAPMSVEPSSARLLNKCLSVMKVNTLAPEGNIIRGGRRPTVSPIETSGSGIRRFIRSR